MSVPGQPWVAYVGPFAYPEGAAASRRVLGVAESLASSGMDVVVASGARISSTGSGERLVPQREGIAYCHLAERVAEHWPRPLRRLRYAWMGRRTVEWLQSRSVLPAAVILYSGYTPYLQRLLPWCRRNGVRLLFDAVEWYEPADRWGYLVSPYQWNIEWAMRRLVPRTDGVIAISRHLAGYYSDKGLPVAVVPPTTSSIAPGGWQPEPLLRLCYTGMPGHKDDLRAVLLAVSVVAEAGAPVRLTVAGPTREQVLELLGPGVRAVPAWLEAPGHLAHAEVRRLVGCADFSILVRRHGRTAEAGFPTKFVESFASGTPVIANLTSDLHLYLRDGETGLVCDAPEASTIASVLRRAIAMDEASTRRMRAASLEEARKAFHPGIYARPLRDLVCPE